MSVAFARGDVHWVDLDPARGSEMTKTRPCVVLSASELNAVRRTVVIVPLTTTPKPVSWPLLIEAPSAGPSSKVRVEHIRALDKSRFGRRLGRLDDEDMTKIEEALGMVLCIRR